MSSVGLRGGPIGALVTRAGLRGPVSHAEGLRLSPGDSVCAEGVSTGGHAGARTLLCPWAAATGVELRDQHE